MADENDMLDEDLGLDDEGRRIILVHRLAKPVQVIGKRSGKEGEVLHEEQELRFREPSASDVIQNGVPSKLVFEEGGYRVDLDEVKMGGMMSALLVSDALPPLRRAMLARLPADEWIAIAYGLARFFMPAQPTA